MSRIESFITQALENERLRIVAEETGTALFWGALVGGLTGLFLGPRAGMATGAVVASTYGLSRVVTVQQLLSMITVAERTALSRMIADTIGTSFMIQDIVFYVSTLARTYNLILESY